MVGVPAPSIFAPHDFKNSARATISGSIAQFFKVTGAFAKGAAIMNVSVAVTETILKNISPPEIPFGAESVYESPLSK